MRVVVLGGGFAGLSAALALQERRHEVLLLERRGVLGGRATSFHDAATGCEVDNGTHLLIGAYEQTLDLLRRAGALELVDRQPELELAWAEGGRRVALRAAPLPAPLHLAAGLLGLGIPWSARLRALAFGLAARLGRPPEGASLAQWFERTGQRGPVRTQLWDPLVRAIFNDAPEGVAAPLFKRVFDEAFCRTRAASCLLLPKVGWAALHDRLQATLEGRGGRLRRRALAQTIEIEGGRVRAVRYVQRAAERAQARAGRPAEVCRVETDAVVVAVPWHALAELLPPEWRAQAPFAAPSGWPGVPIVSVELWLEPALPVGRMLGLRAPEFEWAFDKSRLQGRQGVPQQLSLVASAARDVCARPNAELVERARAALERALPEARQVRVVRSLVLREPWATFPVAPAVEAQRPGPLTPVAGLVLAGDWTATGLPATIEGAVRSGHAAARALEGAAMAQYAPAPP